MLQYITEITELLSVTNLCFIGFTTKPKYIHIREQQVMKKVLAVFLAAAAMVGLTFGQLEAADKYTLRIGTSQTDQAFNTRA